MLTGSIRPADRVEIAAAGPPGLAQQRAAAISGELLRYGVVTTTLALDTVPANHAIVSIGRYAVTLPTCPNWSQSPAADFTNDYSSYYGCATATNLGLMVASPADLVSGRPFSAPDAQPAARRRPALPDRSSEAAAEPDTHAVRGGGGGVCRGRCSDGWCSGRRRPITRVGLRRYWLRHRAISDLRNVFARLSARCPWSRPRIPAGGHVPAKFCQAGAQIDHRRPGAAGRAILPEPQL